MKTPVDPSCLRPPGPWRHRNVSANSAQFHVAETGPEDSNDLVVLLHGFPQFWWAWRHQLTALGEHGKRTVAMDLRGFGGSDKQPKGYDHLTLARDVAGVINGLGAERAVIVGHGIGGSIAWLTPYIATSTIRGIVPVAAPNPVAIRSLRARLFSGSTAEYLRLQVPYFPERSLRSGALITRVFTNWSSNEGKSALLEQQSVYTEAMRLPRASTCSLRHIRETRFLSPRVHSVASRQAKVPVLSIQGQVDPVMPAQAFARDARYVFGQLAQASIPKAGHFIPEEQPQAVTSLILEFLDYVGM